MESNTGQTGARKPAATPEAEANCLTELVAAVKRIAAARPLDLCALRAALVAVIDSDLSDRTLKDGADDVTEAAAKAVLVHRENAVVHSAGLRVGAALSRAAANLDTRIAAGLSVHEMFANVLGLMRIERAVLSVQMDCLFALADYLSLNAEHMRVGARAGAFMMVFIGLRQHGAALVSAAGPALNRMLLSATAFLSARLVTELDDFFGTVGAIVLVLANRRVAAVVIQALEVLSFCCCDCTEALLALEPDQVKLLTAPDLLCWSLERCLAHHAADRAVVLSLLTTLRSLAAVSYHRLDDLPRADDFSLGISRLFVHVMLANASDQNVQELGCLGLYTLCFGCGFPRCPVQLNSSFLQSAVDAGAVVAVAAALRSHHYNEGIFTHATSLMTDFLHSGAVDVAPFTDLVQICVEALDRMVLTEDTYVHSGALAHGAQLLGFMFQHSRECNALGRQVGAAKTLSAVQAILAQRTDISDAWKAIALLARQHLDLDESAKLQSSLPSAGAGRRSQQQHRSKAPLSASELAAATAAADAAAAELLAEEEAEKAAKAPASTAQGFSSQHRRRKKHGGGASAEPDELDAPTLAATMPVMPPVAGAGASAEPSASAKRRQRRIAAKAASHYPLAVRPISPVAAPSPEPALSDAEEQAEPEAPEPLEPAPLPVQMPPPPAPIPAPAPAVEDEAARLRRQLEALQLQNAALSQKTAALERAHESELESQLCSICLDAPRSHVLLPCYHHCLCGSMECFRMLGTPPLCPICRSAVAQTRQIY